MTDTTTARRPWHEVAPSLDAEGADGNTLATYWLTYAQAHWIAYGDAFGGSPEDVARASHPYLWPYMAGWTIAAQAKGWSVERIHEALVDGQTAAEFLWQWLDEAGIDPDSIESAAELAGRVERRIAERQGAKA